MKRKINRKTLLAIAVILIIAAVGIVILTNTDRIAVQLAPKKQPATSRSQTAIKADELFWQTFHHGEYENIQRALDVLTAAYLETPADAVTAAHIAWLHNWRVAQRARMNSVPATITDDTMLARRYFHEAVKLDPSDARTLGFLAGHILAEGTPTSVLTTSRMSRGSPMRPCRRRPTERDECSWPATRRTCIPRPADKDSTSVSRTP